MKRWKGAALLLLCTVVMLRLLQGLAQPEKENAHVPVLGIVTTAAEDDRREAQSEALVHAAEEHGFKVLEMPVERTQEAQIEAVRALIVYQVDAIAFTPLVESGWDNVLREAKSASVPLLSIDRAIRGVDDVDACGADDRHLHRHGQLRHGDQRDGRRCRRGDRRCDRPPFEKIKNKQNSSPGRRKRPFSILNIRK